MMRPAIRTLTKSPSPAFILNYGHQSRSISLLNKVLISSPYEKDLQADIDNCIGIVQKYDPAGYLPGLLQPSHNSRKGYFAARAFWVETGLRFSGQTNKDMSPEDRIKWWRDGIDSVFDGHLNENHPTLRLLHHVVSTSENEISKKHFDDLLTSREKDIGRKQYETVDELIEHSDLTCGSLCRIVLECSGVMKNENSAVYEAAREVGIAHGIANALRTSIPVASQTGKIIIPSDLCVKYGVRSPRYLLSMLGSGDVKCQIGFRNAVADLVLVGRYHLERARAMEGDLAVEDKKGISVLLPGLASETFLNRLESHGFDLTNSDLRRVGAIEHIQCASRMIFASMRKQF